MKITNRMKKILLFLLHPEKTFQWFKNNKMPIAKQNSYSYWDIVQFCVKKVSWRDVTLSERNSYKRTFWILEKLGLVESPDYYSYRYKLTDNGRKIAGKIEKEIRDFIKEYEYLV